MIEEESNETADVEALPVTVATSPSQRPKRNVHQKAIDYTNYGLLWREEKELKKALYASLNETSKKGRSPEMGEDPQSPNIKGHKKTKQSDSTAETNHKKAKVHAQRKFAQGSTPNSPIPTPLKMCSSSNITAVDVFPCRRPKTEDFLTFLCLRGTPILPPSLDFFNNWSRDDSCSEKSYFSEPDNFPEETTPVKDSVDGLTRDGELGGGGGAPKFNFKSTTDMTSFHRQASAKLSAVKQKLNLQDNLDKNNVNEKKRKSSLDESGGSFPSKRISCDAALNMDTLASKSADSELKNRGSSSQNGSSMNALKEKYKKQLLEKKCNEKENTNLKDRVKLDYSKSKSTTPNSSSKISKINAVKREQMKKSLEKRKSLRSARKISEMTPTYLEVSTKNESATRVRRAKLVPPIVEVDSEDSDFEIKSICKDIPIKGSQTKPKMTIDEKSPENFPKSLETTSPNKNVNVKQMCSNSMVKISNNVKHQMVLNQKPVVKLSNIALPENSRLLRVCKGGSDTPPTIVIPKPKIIMPKSGMENWSQIGIKMEKISSNSPVVTPSKRQAPLSPTYKPPPNIVIGESKRCTRSQKLKEIEKEKELNTTKQIVTIKKECLDEEVIVKDVIKSNDSPKKNSVTLDCVAKKSSSCSDKSSIVAKKSSSSDNNNTNVAKKSAPKVVDFEEDPGKKSSDGNSNLVKKCAAKQVELVEENCDLLKKGLVKIGGGESRDVSKTAKPVETSDGNSTTPKKSPVEATTSKLADKKPLKPAETIPENYSSVSKKSPAKVVETVEKKSPVKVVETPVKKVNTKPKISDSLSDKVKPIVKQIKEDLMSKEKLPNVISIDSTTEEESDQSSDDSFLLSSFVKSTIAKLAPPVKDNQPDLDKKPGHSKAKPTKSRRNSKDSTWSKRRKSLDNSTSRKKSGKKNSDSTNSTPSKKKPNKKSRDKNKKKKSSSKTTTKFENSRDLLAVKDYNRLVISDSSSEEELLSSDSSISVILPRPILPLASTSKDIPTYKSPVKSNAVPNQNEEANSCTSYIIESMTRATSGFENISNEMAAATLPGELMFGSAEEIQGLMTSEFSGVFDENFPAGAILLTARDPLTQVPLHLAHDVNITPTKIVVDASTQCEDILISSDSSSKDAEDVVEIISSSTSSSPEIISTSMTSFPNNNSKTKLASSTSSRPSPNFKQRTNQGTKKPSDDDCGVKEASKELSDLNTPSTSTSKRVKNIAKKVEPFPGTHDPAKLVDAPVYAPTVEEFQDPLEFIEKIRPEAEKYGICRIIPPSCFKPECKVNDDMRFTAHNQYIHKMLYRWGPNRQHVAAIRKHLASQSIKMEQAPLIGGIEMDLSRLYKTVQSFGGLKRVMEKKKWQKIADTLHIPKAAQDRVNKLYDAYCKYLVSYATLPKEERDKLEMEVVARREEWLKKKKEASANQNAPSEDDDDDEDEDDDEVNDCVTKGRSVSLSAFYRVARNTMNMWYRNEPQAEEVEKDYWKLVTERSNHVVVHAGNIDSSVYGSGFPTNRNSPFSKHPWNLKVLTNNPGSVLRSMGPVSGVTIPTLHVGMLFTTGCWYRDIHELPWIEYSHTGADKIWYSVPNSASDRFRKATVKIMPDVCRDHPIWLPSDTAMVPPSMLIENGSPLCRTVQESGQFVVIFPSAFTSTICTGYTVSESVYFAPPYWLEMAQSSFQDIQNSYEPPVFSLERLLFAIANDNRTQTETLCKLLPLLKHIRDRELCSRKQLFDIGLKTSERLALHESKSKKRQPKGATQDESDHECEVCRMHCYVSMVVNTVNDSVYCLEHGYQSVQKKDGKNHKQLYTYDQSELNDLVRRVSDMIRNNGDKGGQQNKKKYHRKKLTNTP